MHRMLHLIHGLKIRKWNTYNHEVSKVGRFIAPMMLTYDVTFTTQQNNAGWSISKESTGSIDCNEIQGNY